MLGATHACANPLTKNFGVTHGVAIAVMLSRVVRWNTGEARKVMRSWRMTPGCRRPKNLARRLEELAAFGDLPRSLSALDIPKTALPALAEEARSNGRAASTRAIGALKERWRYTKKRYESEKRKWGVGSGEWGVGSEHNCTALSREINRREFWELRPL